MVENSITDIFVQFFFIIFYIHIIYPLGTIGIPISKHVLTYSTSMFSTFILIFFLF